MNVSKWGWISCPQQGPMVQPCDRVIHSHFWGFVQASAWFSTNHSYEWNIGFLLSESKESWENVWWLYKFQVLFYVVETITVLKTVITKQTVHWVPHFQDVIKSLPRGPWSALHRHLAIDCPLQRCRNWGLDLSGDFSKITVLTCARVRIQSTASRSLKSVQAMFISGFPPKWPLWHVLLWVTSPELLPLSSISTHCPLILIIAFVIISLHKSLTTWHLITM